MGTSGIEADPAAPPGMPGNGKSGTDGRPAGPGAVSAAVAELGRRFPGVPIWFGTHTGRWWAYLPVGERGRLVEAIEPRELAVAITAAGGWPWP